MRSLLSFVGLAFSTLLLKVLAGELHKVLGVAADHLLGEVLQDGGEVLGHLDLISAEDAHFANVCHLSQFI